MQNGGEVLSFVEKYPDKASSSINIFNDNVMYQFRNILKQTKTNLMEQFFSETEAQ